MRNYFYCITCLLFLFSCKNNSTKTEPLTTDQKFVGNWIVVANNFTENQNDHSMDGIIQPLTKMENSEETYSFKLYTGNNLILSKQDENTLVGVNAKMEAKYVDSTEHLILFIGKNSTMEFKKLK
ncbi:hypothetical protein H9N25_10375 [Pedobacter riviphilus]|uniref:Lipocalin-like domain-containing protein n=1 Tax=Pedobacter riviphilus TaxID=2766984 RepID=A0ABX6TQ87_9SPHI|nr:hypothetical protein [Pedobacter riviphilus]QNR86750.1 hypothetical protein H9N25_10375 [Pedobacter riviphilus]